MSEFLSAITTLVAFVSIAASASALRWLRTCYVPGDDPITAAERRINSLIRWDEQVQEIEFHVQREGDGRTLYYVGILVAGPMGAGPLQIGASAPSFIEAEHQVHAEILRINAESAK